MAFQDPLAIDSPGDWQATDGYSDDPSRASADLGRLYFAAATDAVADALRTFARRTGAEPITREVAT